jgi:hypothetical protein
MDLPLLDSPIQDAEGIELHGHQFGRAMFFESGLGVGVNIMPPPGHFRLQLFDFFDNRHLAFLSVKDSAYLQDLPVGGSRLRCPSATPIKLTIIARSLQTRE